MLELLEDRTLLSGAALADFSSLVSKPNSYELDSILVRFRSEPTRPAAALAGTALDPEIPLVPALHKVNLGPGVTVNQALAAYQADPDVLYAEPNYRVYLTDTIPNDPGFDNPGMYGLRKIQMPAAWDISVGAPGNPVAVIDTGVDYNHEDLFNNIWINQAEIPASRLANLVDVDGDGLITFNDLNDPINQGPYKITDVNGDGRIDAADILAPMDVDTSGNDLGTGGWANGSTQDGDGQHPDDLIGWNFYSGTNNPSDGYGHGSHTSGTIGAEGNNGVGVVGVNWYTQLMPLKIFSDSAAYSSDAAVIEAISFAVYH
ncbi:MAG TPA: S8 family serine peptidase, partial [Gemmataceae bacterium]|nr:S8 family serine peptidase [Gemmataceae bacterium]